MTPEEPEVEEDRRRRLAEAGDGLDLGWSDAFLPGTFGCHELLDRISVLSNSLDDAILDHPALLLDPPGFQMASRAAELLADLYQRVGARHLEDDATPVGRPPVRHSEGLTS